MTINYTTLLGLAKPVTGTESGAWGDVINDQITSLVEDAIANAVSISVAAGNVTLSDNDGSTDQSRMAILLITGSPGTTRNIVAPSRSKWYIVRNGSDSSVVVKGSATTGVTIAAGKTALVFWNGTDFATVASNNVNLTTDVTGTLPVANGGTGATTLASGQFLKGAGTSQVTTAATVALESEVSGTLPVVNGGTGATSSTGTGSVVLSTSPTLVTPILGAASATSVALGAGAEGTPSLTATGDLNTGMWFPAADTLAWSTGGGERVRVDSSGNVGIGTTSPTGGRLHVSQSSGSAIFGSTAGGTGYGGSFENIDAGTTKFVRVAGSGGNGVFSAGVGASTQLLLDTSGNLGVGATSPGSFDSAWQRLVIGGGSGDVGQTIYSGSASIGTIAFADGTSGAQQYAGLIRYLHASDAMTFWANATERMRITSGGSVGIGTDTPRAQTHVFGLGQSVANLTDAGNRGGMLRVSDNNAAAGSGGAVLFASAQGDTANSLGFAAIKGILADGGGNTVGDLSVSFRSNIGDTNLTERVRITSAGYVGIGTNAPVSKLHVVDFACIVSATSTSGTVAFQANASGTNDANVILTNAGGERARITATNADRLEFATGASVVVRAAITSTGNFQFNSGYGSVATAYGCRAWINFNGTGTPAKRGDGNVSTITDHGVGDYTLNFTNSMPDTNYAVVGTAFGPSGANQVYFTTPTTVAYNTASVRIGIWDGFGFYDAPFINAAIFR